MEQTLKNTISDKGWISLHRKIFENEFYFSEKFTKMSAWIDLLLLANFQDSKVLKEYTSIVVRKGQLITSQVSLAKRWKWHRESVSKFLNAFVMKKMITLKVYRAFEKSFTVITIQKYDEYQVSQQGTVRAVYRVTSINNNDNNENKKIIPGRRERESGEWLATGSPPELRGPGEGEEEKASAFFLKENNNEEQFKNLIERRKEWTSKLREISIFDICQKLGITVTHEGKVACHGEKTPSCDIREKQRSNRFKCFGCGQSGGSIDFVMLMEGVDFTAACDRLANLFGVLKPGIEKKYYEDYVTYLKTHGLTLEQFEKFGYYSKQYGGSLAVKVPTGIRYRILKAKDGEEKFRNKNGTSTCVFKTAIPDDGILFLAEGEVDAISLFSNTGLASWSLTAGARTFPIELLSHFENIKTVYLCFDNDESGKAGAELAMAQLGQNRTRVIQLPPGIKDISEFFGQGKTREDFEKLIKDATQLLTDYRLNITPAFRM